jgi:hypothetical protein
MTKSQIRAIVLHRVGPYLTERSPDGKSSAIVTELVQIFTDMEASINRSSNEDLRRRFERIQSFLSAPMPSPLHTTNPKPTWCMHALIYQKQPNLVPPTSPFDDPADEERTIMCKPCNTSATLCDTNKRDDLQGYALPKDFRHAERLVFKSHLKDSSGDSGALLKFACPLCWEVFKYDSGFKKHTEGANKLLQHLKVDHSESERGMDPDCVMLSY